MMAFIRELIGMRTKPSRKEATVCDPILEMGYLADGTRVMLRGQDWGRKSEYGGYVTEWRKNGEFLILSVFMDQQFDAANAIGEACQRREKHDIKVLAAVGVFFEDPRLDAKFVAMEYT